MMLHGLLTTLFIVLSILLILLILVQKGKGGMGLGSMGGGTQMLFGGSGGQDLFQKITWVLGGIFLFGSLTLALMKTSGLDVSRYVKKTPIEKQQQIKR
ncbi:preprotein translocase subunit SecG [bacterium]|jgi:preprotein translocase subunit SecG|nr:preprotein translocase subunit SecG [bacterium]